MICFMILLHHNVYLERRKTIITFLITEWSLFVKPRVPFTQECFVPSFVEIGPVVLERKFFKFRQCIFAISLLSPFGKRHFPSFERTRLPFTKGCFVPSLVEISPVVREKKIFKFRQCIFAIW